MTEEKLKSPVCWLRGKHSKWAPTFSRTQLWTALGPPRDPRARVVEPGGWLWPRSPRTSGVGAGLERQCRGASGCSPRAQLASRRQDEQVFIAGLVPAPGRSPSQPGAPGSPNTLGTRSTGGRTRHPRTVGTEAPEAAGSQLSPGARDETRGRSRVMLSVLFHKTSPASALRTAALGPSQPSGFFPLPAASSLAPTFP